MDRHGSADRVAGLLRRDAVSLYGRGLRFGETHPDEDEFLDVTYLPFDRAVAQCMDGTLTDAKTVAAILKAKILLGR